VSLNAVMGVLQAKLNGWQTPAMESANPPIAPIECFIAPPQVVINAMEGPQVFIWGGHADVHRTTAPRSSGHTGGFKRAPWKVDTFVFFIDSPTADATDFQTILDGLRWAIEDIGYPQTITDLNSQPQVTQLIMIGENITMSQHDPEPTEDQSQLLYTAHLIVEMTEDYQA